MSATFICHVLLRCVGWRVIQSKGRQIHKTQREEEKILQRGIKRKNVRLRREVRKEISQV